jgi:hypothetical protein
MLGSFFQKFCNEKFVGGREARTLISVDRPRRHSVFKTGALPIDAIPPSNVVRVEVLGLEPRACGSESGEPQPGTPLSRRITF